MLENIRLISYPYCASSCQMAIVSCTKVSHFHIYNIYIYKQYSCVVTLHITYFFGLKIKHRHYFITVYACAVTYNRKFCIVHINIVNCNEWNFSNSAYLPILQLADI